MSHEIEKLSAAMRAAPSPEAKSRAMDAAMRAFDEEFDAARQETGAPARQISRKPSYGSKLMTMLKSFGPRRPVLLGGASLAAMSLALVVTWRAAPPEPAFERQEPARTSAADAPTEKAEAMAEADIAAAPPPSAAGAARLRAASPSDMASRADSAPRPIVERELAAPGFSGEATRGDRFAAHDPNPVKRVAETPVSTFSIDVDSASYAWMRRSLREGHMPDPASIRVEELINYFPYDYAAPASAGAPFAVTTTLMDAPWAEGRQLLHVGLRGYAPAERKRANLTFLIDTSGSMGEPDKLPLLVTSLRLLIDALDREDSIAIVTYAGSSEVTLPPTRAAERGALLDALDRLQAGGGTAGAAGIETAYRLAEDRFDPEKLNRVILATDGDFNIGAGSEAEMKALIAKKRESGVLLSVLGFGRGNLNDALMQTLAEAGDGQAAYIDSLAEAQKSLVEELSTLEPIARDVKIQIEFNPALVEDYRLIGYESRALAREDFGNDRVDAGEIGAGHRVTAIYEITPAGGPSRVDPLRYQPAAPAAAAKAPAGELAFLRLRWKAPEGGESRLMETVIGATAETPGREANFAAAVAGFGQILTGGAHLGGWSYDAALALASGARGEDPFGYRSEFLDLIRLARALDR
ncbi:MAG: von Willebrand factor type A domain-containing protein [Paracoccaceae bacterium]